MVEEQVGVSGLWGVLQQLTLLSSSRFCKLAEEELGCVVCCVWP
jgi:hypothetical protein